MTYVVSDLHGNYDKFKELIEKIGLKETDILYVLGDIVDYGEQSMELIGDLSVRYNVYAIAGEHDFLALRMLSGFEKMLSGEATPDADFIADMQEWVKNGGQSTLDGFRALDSEMREGVIDYLSDLALYEQVRADVLHARATKHIDYETSHERIVGAEPAVQDALIAFLNGGSYEEVIRLAIYMGGDADTEAAIAGGIAAAYYGVPEDLVKSALIYIPSDMLKVINAVDGTDWKCSGLIPPKSSRWSINDIVVYGSSVDGTDNEKAYHLTHKTLYSKHFNRGYAIPVIGNDHESVKAAVEELRRRVSERDARWHIHEIGLEKAGYTVEQYRELFSWALEMDNVLVSPSLR